MRCKDADDRTGEVLKCTVMTATQGRMGPAIGVGRRAGSLR